MEEETTCQQLQAPGADEITPEARELMTDAALASVGLQKVTAFVRAEQSGNAKRKQRSREKSEQLGVKQLNIQLPAQTHQIFKDIAQELQRTGDMNTALQNVLTKLGRPAETALHPRERLTGWRRWLARLLRLI